METKNIMIVGVGGQGTLLASKLLGAVLLKENYDVKVSEVHGMSQRGGSVVTYVRYGQKVYSPIIDKGQADIILSFELLEAARWLEYLKPGGQIIVNTQRTEPMPVIIGAAEYPEDIEAKLQAVGALVEAKDFLEIANKAGSSKAVNIALMGKLSNYFTDIPESTWLDTMNEIVPAKFLELNKRAFELGKELLMADNYKIIDFHTHTFAKAIAGKAIDRLSHSANIISYTDGTDDDLLQKNIADKIEISLVLPVATKVHQGQQINEINARLNERADETGIRYFAAIHPGEADIKSSLLEIKRAGFSGIKLHPIFQNCPVDDMSFMKLIDVASDMDLVSVIHAGMDISFLGNDMSSVARLIHMLETVKPEKVVLAHMGGWSQWNQVESDLAGFDVYFDTSFCLERPRQLDSSIAEGDFDILSIEQFKRLVVKHGSNKILFGTDSPWADRKREIDLITGMGFDRQIEEAIFFNNAKKLLKI